MKKGLLFKVLHVVLYTMVLVFIIVGFFIARKGQDAFMEYLREDGAVENLTFMFLLLSSAVAAYRCFHAPEGVNRLYWLTWIGLALLFFFAAGEEISWGQRIFNWKTSGIFETQNLQHETNLHNLEIGGVKINKLIFSQLMGVMMGIYFVLLRPLAMKAGSVNRLVKLFSIPLPRWNHIVALLVTLVLCSQYHLKKAAELRELAFAVIMFLIFLYPAVLNALKKEIPSAGR
jgi:hypothetical protein